MEKQTNFYATLLYDKRRALKMTQEAVAKYMGVTRRTYQRMEEGNISLPDLLKLCKLLEFDILMIPNKYL